MKYYIRGNGHINLSKKDFISSGGEGSVYAQGDQAYKIYTDPKKMILEAKIKELAVLSHSDIIKPQDIILDKNNRAVGYTMKYLKDCFILCQLFPKIFKNRSGLTLDNILSLVELFKSIVSHVHERNILIVDANELNFLISQDFKSIYFIDVYSYQSRSYPAHAIMDNIRDRHASIFSELSDWFSWAVITFQLFTGIHPYKGKHQQLATLDERMTQNISVYNKNVRVPKVCESFAVIPKQYSDWYYAVFEQGQRLLPPFNQTVTITFQPIIQDIQNTNLLDIELIKKFNEAIMDYDSISNYDIVKTASNYYINDKINHNIKLKSKTALSPKTNHLITAYIDNEKLRLFNTVTNKPINCDIHGEQLLSYNHRFYVKSLNHIFELQFLELSNKIEVVPEIVGQTMEKSSRFFDGVVLQEMLDTYYVSVFPKAKTCYQIKIDELVAYKIIDAKLENEVLIVITHQDGRYDQFIFRFHENYSKYDIRVIEDVHSTAVNFVVLENGVCARYTDQDELELFMNKMGQNEVKIIDDPAVAGIKLAKNGNQVIGIKNNAVYNIAMKA